jgi:hypothetical protein
MDLAIGFHEKRPFQSIAMQIGERSFHNIDPGFG